MRHRLYENGGKVNQSILIFRHRTGKHWTKIKRYEKGPVMALFSFFYNNTIVFGEILGEKCCNSVVGCAIIFSEILS